MINWLKENRDFIDIRAIEKVIGCPKDTIQRAITGKTKLPKKWENKLKSCIYKIFQSHKFQYGKEFSLNGNIFYPAYLDYDSLIEISNKFIKVLSVYSKEKNYEARVSRIIGGKGLDLELYTNEKNNIHNIIILPDWNIQIISEHPIDNLFYEKFEKIIEDMLKKILKEHKENGKLHFKKAFLNEKMENHQYV